MNKLWLDDVRKPPDDSWTWCKSVEEALAFVRENECEEWALDHDLGGQLAHYGKGAYDFKAPTGMDFIAGCLPLKLLPTRCISIHSTNGEAINRMVHYLYAFCVMLDRDIEIIVRPMRGRIMDQTPYYDPELRK